MAASAATVAPPPTVDRASSRKGTTQFTFHEDPPTPEAVPESAAPSKTLPRLDTSTSSASSSARGPRSASDALISPSSARASDSGFSPSSSRPPKPPSRPPSRPPSLSRPPSVYRPRSPSSVSRLSSSGGAGGTYGGPGTTLHTDPKRLSASSGTSGGGGGHGHGGFSPSSPRSPARSSGGVATSPQIPEDAAVSAASSTTSTDQTTPSPSAAVAEPPPMPKASEPGAAPASASGVVAPTEEPAAPAAATAEPHADPADTPADLPVFVRDYAFPREDPRFKGEMLPEEIEAAARKQRFRESGAEQGFLVDEDGMGPPVGGGGAGGNSSFHWGFVTCHTADFPGSEVEDDEYESGDGHVGYGVYDPTHAGFGDYGEEGDEDAEDDEEDEAELGEFVPGVYSAVFAFEPELDTEMRLVEGELVSVFERQCRGWVQAGRIVDNVVTEEIGLVPENYLALVEPHEGVVDWSSHDFEHEPEQLHEHEQEAEHTVKPAVGAAALSAEQAPHARSEAVPA